MTTENKDKWKFHVKDDIYIDPITNIDIPRIIWAMNNKIITATLRGPPVDPYSETEAIEFVELSKSPLKNGMPAIMAIRDYNNNGSTVMIGSVAIRPDEDYNFISFGYWLDPAYWGKGLMSKVVNLMVYKIGVDTFGVKKFQAGSYADNWGSRKVLEKNGFKLVSVKEKSVTKLVTNEVFDEWSFELDLNE